MVNFNQKTIAVSLLMFITVVAPTLTFGAVYGTNTENRIGAIETIIATSWVGIFFSLFSGMPVVSVWASTKLHDVGSIDFGVYLIVFSLMPYSCFFGFRTGHHWIDRSCFDYEYRHLQHVENT